MRRLVGISIIPLSLLALAITVLLALSSHAPVGATAFDGLNHEVWIIDQSGFPASAVPAADIGGTLYIFDGSQLAREVSSAVPEVLDLADLVQRLDPSAQPAALHHL